MALSFAFTKLKQDEVVSFAVVNNKRSRAVMERLGMQNTQQNFAHPFVPADSPLSEHVLYRMPRDQWEAKV